MSGEAQAWGTVDTPGRAVLLQFVQFDKMNDSSRNPHVAAEGGALLHDHVQCHFLRD